MASRSLGTLTVDLVAKVGGFTEGMSKADRETQKRMRAIRKSIDDTAASVKRFVAVGAAAGAAAAAVTVALVNNARQAIDTQAKLARTLGSTVEGLQVATRAGELSGVAFGQLEQFTKDLTRRLAQAADGTGPAVKALERLRLTAEELQALPLDQRIALIRARLDEFVPVAQRAAVAGQLFGEEGSLNALRFTAENIERARREIDLFGAALSEIDAVKVEQANDALSSIAIFKQGFANRLTVELAPLFTLVTEWLTDTVENAGGLDVAFRTAFGSIADGALVAAAAIRRIVISLDNLAAKAKEVTTAAFGASSQAGEDARTQYLATFEVLRGRLPAVALFGETLEETRVRLRELGYKFTQDVVQDAENAPKVEGFWEGLVGDLDSDPWLQRQREALERLEQQAEATARATATASGAAGGPSVAPVAGVGDEMVTQRAEYFAGLLRENRALLTGVDDATFKYSETLRGLSDLLQGGAITQEQFNTAVAAAADARAEDIENASKDLDRLTSYADQAARNMQTAFADFLFDPFDKGLKGMLQSFADTLQRLAAEAAASAIFDKIFGSLGQGGGLGGFLGDLLGGASGRAFGGPVMAGVPYQVGEMNRPELLIYGNRQYLIPGDNGRVEPMGGGTNQVFNITTPNADSFRASERQILRRARRGLIA